MDVARADIEALIDRYPQRARSPSSASPSAPSLDWPLSADTWSLRPVMDDHHAVCVRPRRVTTDQRRCGEHRAALPVDQRGPAVSTGHDPGLLPRRRRAVSRALPAREFEPPEDRSTAAPCSDTAPRPVRPDSQAPISNDPRSTKPRCGQSPTSSTCRIVARSAGAPLVTALPDAGAADEQAAAVAPAARADRNVLVPALSAAVLILIELYFVLREFRRSRLVSVDVVP